MKINDLIYQDKISTPTDKKYTLTSVICGGGCAAVMATILILVLTAADIYPLYAVLGVAAGMLFTVSLIFTAIIALRKRSLRVLISSAFLLAAVSLLVAVIIIL